MKTKQIGEILQEEREKKHFSREDFAAQTRIRLEYLTALENNEFSSLPAATFVKGYIKTYARELGFEYQPLIALLRRDYKESTKGTLVPREFIKPMLKRQTTISNITLLMVALIAVFLVLIGYVGVQWYNLQKPPLLVLSSPKDAQSVSGTVLVKGRTSPDAIVAVNDQPVATQVDGVFETTLSFETQGVATVLVTVTDARGKTTQKQSTVYVQF